MSNSNTTVNTANTTYSNKTFYDRALLEIAKTRLVHASYGQKRSIPRNSGKRVEFRRYELFTPDANALVLEEGVTPAGQSLAQSKIEAEVKQYGAYVEVSDLLDLTSFDPVLTESTELLGEQLGTVVEWITRDAMCAGTNVQYANGKTNRLSLEAGDKLTVTEIRKAVRSLKKAKARMFNNVDGGTMRKPHFVCICSPDATYDLQSDPLWQDVSKYSDVEQIYSGEIGRLFGVVFVESTEATLLKVDTDVPELPEWSHGAMIGYAVGRERASGDAGSIASARACFELYNAAKRMMRAHRGEMDAYAIENR